jgi:hypothetical protein
MLTAYRTLSATVGLIVCVVVAAAALGPLTHPARAAGSLAPQCRNPNEPATRNPANPLMLRTTPAAGDPIEGASFFTPGPARGDAAGAIAQLLGYDKGQRLSSGLRLTSFRDTETWASWAKVVARKLPYESARVQRQIRLLEKIADQPQPLRISDFSEGGTPTGVYTQTRKLFCTILKADPHTIPLLTTYFLHPELGSCATTAEIDADSGHFESQINAAAEAIGRRPVVMFLELDAVGSSRCMVRTAHSIAAWDALVRYEAETFEALPHTVVYLEGGYSDANTSFYASKLLNAMGIRDVQGFYTNDTHLEWTTSELRYAEQISRRTGGAHFVINTSSNGRGPKLNPHPKTEGVEDLCNPPARGLGMPDTTTPGLNPHLDALLWVVPPGDSSGTCHGGPASGVFWVSRAETLAANANLKLGPGNPFAPF